MNNDTTNVMQPTFFDHLGMEKWKHDDGSFMASIDVQEIHKDEAGDIASGVCYTLMDVALGGAVSEKAAGFAITIDLHVQTFKQVQCEKLICKAYAIHINGNNGNGKGDVFDENGNLVATGVASFKIIEAIDG